jgi:CRP-like cAMP-binding protein
MLEHSSLLDEIRDMLLNSTLLSNLPPDEILSAARYFSLSHIEQGNVIFNEGDMGTFMGLIIEGKVSVQKSNQDGDDVELANLPKGRTFGGNRLYPADPVERNTGKDDPRVAQNCSKSDTRNCDFTVAQAAHGRRQAG